MHRPFLTSLLAFLLTLPLASFSQPLNETSCTPKDLRDARLGPIRDTKNMNWSYAVASADLLTHHMNLAVGQRVSAEALALELQTTHPLQNFTDSMSDLRFFTQMMDAQGKVTAKNNTAARTLGHHQNPDKYLCLESEVGSSGYEGADLTEVFDLIDDAATLYRGKKSENFDCNSEYGQAIHQLFPTLALDEITLALAQSSWNSTRNFVDLKDKSCKTRLNFPEGLTINSQRFSQRRANEYLNVMHQALESGHPAMIALDEAILTGSTRAKLVHGNIVGRRFNNGVCEVLVRGAYGADCDRFKNNLTCEAGHVWISEVDLRPSIERIVTLTPQ